MNSALFRFIVKTNDSAATILIRLLVSLVFLPEGIQKLIFPEILGSGRFLKIGIPYSDIMGPFVGVNKLICGLLILLGLFTRLASIPLLIIMVVAIISTKIPILLGHDWWLFHVAKFSRYGFWSMMHEIRTDMTMLLASLYLLIRGGGQWSIDACIYRLYNPAKFRQFGVAIILETFLFLIVLPLSLALVIQLLASGKSRCYQGMLTISAWIPVPFYRLIYFFCDNQIWNIRI